MINDVIYNRLCDFDEYSRDKDGNDCNDNKLNQFIKNILFDDSLKVCYEENYLKYLLRINDQLYRKKYDFLFDYMKNEPERYVTSYIKGDIIKNWSSENSVFILAGTGKGKNYFVKESLIRKYPNKKIVMFVNRQMLLKQQKEIIEKNASYSANLIEGFKTKGIAKLNNNFMLISYQQAAISIITHNKEVINYLSEVQYAVFDEVHYLLDDSPFNKGVNIIMDELVNKNSKSNLLKNAVRIFMSATMEEMLIILRKQGYKFKKFQEFKTFSSHPNRKKVMEMMTLKEYIINLPTDYRYIEPCMYSDVYDLIDTITDSNEKWLIFVDSKSVGEKLCDEINNKIGSKEKDEAVFINADNKDNDRFQTIINNERFEERVLIATSVIYNGVNLKDDDLKNIVLPFVNVPMAKQMIGRKRIEKEDKVRVYFKNVDLTTIKQAFTNNVSKYLDIMELERMDNAYTTGVLNGLIKVRDEFLCFYYKKSKLKQTTNRMACQKLHFDSMFLLYTLQKISKQQDSSYARIMLEHLGIGEKFKKIKENELLTEEKKHLEAQKKLIEWLEKYSDETNGTFKFIDGESKKLREFNVSFNDIYYMVYNRNVNTQYKRGDRSIPKKDIQQLIDELGLPYNVTIDAKNGDVKKVYIEKVCKHV